MLFQTPQSWNTRGVFVGIQVIVIAIRMIFLFFVFAVVIFIMLALFQVLYISDGCCTEFNVYYFILYLF